MSEGADLFSAEQWAWYRDVELNSDSTDCTRGLLDEILNTLMNNGWENKLVFGVHLSMEEALVNAVKHGNNTIPPKRFTFASASLPICSERKLQTKATGSTPTNFPIRRIPII